MVAFGGRVATAGLLLERETRAPPLGAGALSVTVPVEGDPPMTLLGFSVSEVRVGPGRGTGVTVSVAVCCWDMPAWDAEMVTGVELATTVVVIWKVAMAVPAATVTLAGTVATEVLLLERETTVPPPGAGPLRITFPVEGFPPLTLVGFSVSEVRVGPEEAAGVTVSEAVCCWDTPAWDAEMITGVELATAMVVIWNVALAVPAATVTLAGTVAMDVLLLERETTVPPPGAGPLRVTLPVEGFPPVTLVGLSVSEVRVAEPGGWGGTVSLTPQELEQSETASSPSAAARPGR